MYVHLCMGICIYACITIKTGQTQNQLVITEHSLRYGNLYNLTSVCLNSSISF